MLSDESQGEEAASSSISVAQDEETGKTALLSAPVIMAKVRRRLNNIKNRAFDAAF